MKVYTCPEICKEDVTKTIWCFLAGGITGCWNWQKAVIECLEKYDDTENLIIFNPRRENFNVDDTEETYKQIRWEYDYLHAADIFSMYFAGGESVQPICMFELGKYLPWNGYENSIVSCEQGYKRLSDVVIQCSMDAYYDVDIFADPERHAKRIYEKYKKYKEAMKL